MTKVRKWINLILALRTVAEEDEDPLNIIERYEVEGLTSVLHRLNLQTANINPDDQEEAVDVATLMAGYVSPSKEELTWELN